MGTPTSITCTISVPGAPSATCAALGTNIYTALPTDFIKNAVNTTYYFGRYAKASMNKGRDWFRLTTFPTFNGTSPDIVNTTSCNALLGYNFTVFYSEALVRNNSFLYLQHIRVVENRQPVALTSTSVTLRHNFDYVFVPSQQLSAFEEFEKRFETGFRGVINSVFKKVVLPILQPSSVKEV